MDNQNPETQPQTPQQPPTSVPPPPKGPEIKMRTMESDVKSVEQSGGGIPEPETINPEELESGALAPPLPPPPLPPPSGQGPASLPPEEKAEVSAAPPKKISRWLIWLLVVAIVLSLGVAGYVYLSSYFLTALPLPAGGPAPAQPPSQTPAAPVVPVGRQSIFGLEDREVAVVDFGDYNVVNILTGLQNEAAFLSADQPFREIKFSALGAPADFSQFLVTLLPELEGAPTASALETDFNNDFTAFLYYQDGQVWPGYVVRKKEGAAPSLNKLADIEKSSISNIFLALPSGQTSFSAGPVGDKYTSRYGSFSNKPASFNYGIFGDYLIITTTFQGLTGVIELLGL